MEKSYHSLIHLWKCFFPFILYKIVIRPNQDYENLFIECVVAGEDGSTEQLKINKFMYAGKSITCKGNKAGPVKVSKDSVAEFMVTFDRKEKMGLNLLLTEGGSLWVII